MMDENIEATAQSLVKVCVWMFHAFFGKSGEQNTRFQNDFRAVATKKRSRVQRTRQRQNLMMDCNTRRRRFGRWLRCCLRLVIGCRLWIARACGNRCARRTISCSGRTGLCASCGAVLFLGRIVVFLLLSMSQLDLSFSRNVLGFAYLSLFIGSHRSRAR